MRLHREVCFVGGDLTTGGTIECSGPAVRWDVLFTPSSGKPVTLRRGAFRRRRRCPVWLAHDRTRAIGRTVEITNESEGLYVRALIGPRHAQGVLRRIVAGELTGFSVGAVWRQIDGVVESGDALLREISLVAVPGCPDALFDAVVIHPPVETAGLRSWRALDQTSASRTL